MGEDILGNDDPPFIHPEELGRVIIYGEQPDKPEYEPFTPTSYYYIASYSHVATAEGDYYIAVYSEHHGGKYGMAIGYRETFTLFEWIKIPIDLVEIHLWEGEPLLLLFGPPLATLVAAIYVSIIRSKKQALGKLAGTLYLSSGAMTLTQMIVYLLAAGLTSSALLTSFFVFAQLGLGFFCLRNKDDKSITWIGLGFAGLIFWAGWIIGPVIAIVAGVVKKYED